MYVTHKQCWMHPASERAEKILLVVNVYKEVVRIFFLYTIPFNNYILSSFWATFLILLKAFQINQCICKFFFVISLQCAELRYQQFTMQNGAFLNQAVFGKIDVNCLKLNNQLCIKF